MRSKAKALVDSTLKMFAFLEDLDKLLQDTGEQKCLIMQHRIILIIRWLSGTMTENTTKRLSLKYAGPFNYVYSE